MNQEPPERPGDVAGSGPLADREAGDPPVPFRRLAHAVVNHLGAVGVDVEVKLQPDGRVAISLPLQWAELHLATLRAQAEDYREKLHRAAQQEAIRQAELRVTSGEALRKWEAEQAALYADYKRLVAKGAGHREALHRLKKEVGEHLTITDLHEVIRGQGVQERRQARTDQAERIRRQRGQLTARQIAKQEGLNPWQVQGVLRKGKLPGTQAGPRAAQRERRERILGLHAQGYMPEAIREQTGFTHNQVMRAIQGIPRGAQAEAADRAEAGGREQRPADVTQTPAAIPLLVAGQSLEQQAASAGSEPEGRVLAPACDHPAHWLFPHPREVWEAVGNLVAANPGLDEEEVRDLLSEWSEDAKRKPPVTPEGRNRLALAIVTGYAIDELLTAEPPALQGFIQAAHETTAKPKNPLEARARELAARGADREWLRAQQDAAERESGRYRRADWWLVARGFESWHLRDAVCAGQAGGAAHGSGGGGDGNPKG